MRQRFEMCIINRDLVDDLAQMAGTNGEVTQRLGISLNSWIKIVAGMPVRKSLGLRLRERTLAQAPSIEAFRKKFPNASAPDGIDRDAIAQVFLKPVCDPIALDAPAFRSVRRAMAFANATERS